MLQFEILLETPKMIGLPPIRGHSNMPRKPSFCCGLD